MVNWKNLKNNPPCEDCNICIKVGDNYETFKFIAHTSYSWSLYKYPKTIASEKVPEEAFYINLDDIK